MTGLTRAALDRWRLVLAVTLVLVVTGVMTYFTHPSQEDPEITIRTAVVTARFPGMSAERVEQLLVKSIEEAARQIAEVDTIESAAQTGFATVKVELRSEVTLVKPVWARRSMMTMGAWP